MAEKLKESELIIRPLGLNEISRAVAVHTAAFPNFFLTILGNNFLELLYRFYVTGESEVALAVLHQGQVIGSALGTSQPQQFYRRLAVKNSWQFALAAFKPFLKKPAILPRLLRALVYRGDYPPLGTDGALLASICVDPLFQNKGVGQNLLAAFEKEVFRRGATFIYLVTERNNQKVRNFYEKLGWSVTERFTTREGRNMVVYCKFRNIF